MEQYISKAAVVAEIKRLSAYLDTLHEQRIIEKILSIIDTIEVKDVDLDTEQRQYLTKHFNVYDDGVLQSKKSGLPLRTYDIIKVAKYFFELCIKVAQKENKPKKGL